GHRPGGRGAARVAAAPASGETARMRSRARLSALGVRAYRGIEPRTAWVGRVRGGRLDAALIQHSGVDTRRVRGALDLGGLSRAARLKPITPACRGRDFRSAAPACRGSA